MAAWMVGIDTGGTFTDLIAFDADSGARRLAKVSSDPSDPSQAVIRALDELFAGAQRHPFEAPRWRFSSWWSPS